MSTIIPPRAGTFGRPRPTEHEILRISACLGGDDLATSLQTARTTVLRWAQARTAGRLPDAAWKFESFDHLAGGRDCSAVRFVAEGDDVWIVRAEDPDKTVPGRIWTTEIAVAKIADDKPRFTLRLVASSPEPMLDVEPSVPGVVLQVINSPGLSTGNFQRLSDKPVVVRSERQAQLLIDALVDPDRKLPVIVLSVPSTSVDLYKPLLDAPTLAKAAAGLALVVVLPAQASWSLTERFGKQLSVYEGAARVYLPGFTEDANPFSGHQLILPQWLSTPSQASFAMARLRWAAATGSVRRLQLVTDVMSFAAYRVRVLEQRQRELTSTGATEKEQLGAAQQKIDLLVQQLGEKTRWEEELYRLFTEAEERAEAAETLAKASGFRIQQLESQITSKGGSPDEGVKLPTSWEGFSDWCDDLAGRVVLSPQTRKSIKSAVFEDVELTGRCLLWLANTFRTLKLDGSDGSLRDLVLESGITNAHCGNDCFDIEWQGKKHGVEWHIKNGGNTHDPKRCLRIYYFWDETSLQTVIARMPAHLRTEAT
jgi:hypothetical protein